MPPKTVLSGEDIDQGATPNLLVQPGPVVDDWLLTSKLHVALEALDAEVGRSELLMSVAPIRLMCSGGCVAVKYFHVRPTTKDVDYMIDPNVDAAPEYRQALLDAVGAVAAAMQLQHDWMKDDLKSFIRSPKRMDLFLASVGQNIVLFSGANVVVYAASMEWALERKIRRVNRGRAVRHEDLSDAAAIIKHMKGRGPPVSIAYLKGLNYNGFEGPMDLGIELVRREYEKVYGEVGIADII